MSEWVEWHAGYAEGQPLAMRLRAVQAMIRQALDRSPPGPIRVISMCAGDGRDLLGMLADHARRTDVQRASSSSTPSSRNEPARARVTCPAAIDVVNGDASNTSAYAGAVPADIVLVCGVFGNITDDDVHRTVEHLAELCAPDATVIWTRGAFAPDLTPTIRAWFTDAGFAELAFVAIPDATARVGADRLVVPPRPYEPDVRLFTFLARERRPSRRG